MSKKNKGGGVMVTENGDAVYAPGTTVEESMPDGAPVVGTGGQPKPKRDPRESFIRLAERRVNRALKDIRALIPLANRSAYVYDNDEGTEIVDALHAAVMDLIKAFAGQKQDRPMFRLSAVRASAGSSNGDTAQS